MQKARSCSHAGSEEVPLKDTKAFGDLVTMDHKVNIEKGEGCPVFNDEAGKGKHMLVTLGLLHSMGASLSSSLQGL